MAYHLVDLAKLFFERRDIQPPATWPCKVTSITSYRFDLLPKECTQHLSELFPHLGCVVIHHNQLKQANMSNVHAALAACKQLHTLVFEDDEPHYYYFPIRSAITEFTTNHFSYPPGLKTLVVPGAFGGSLGSLRIPSSVETLCMGCFDNQKERMLYLLQHPDKLIEFLHYLRARWVNLFFYHDTVCEEDYITEWRTGMSYDPLEENHMTWKERREDALKIVRGNLLIEISLAVTEITEYNPRLVVHAPMDNEAAMWLWLALYYMIDYDRKEIGSLIQGKFDQIKKVHNGGGDFQTSPLQETDRFMREMQKVLEERIGNLEPDDNLKDMD